jgi:hypothetical protein
MHGLNPVGFSFIRGVDSLLPLSLLKHSVEVKAEELVWLDSSHSNLL